MRLGLYLCVGPFIEPREAWIVAKTKHFIAHYDQCRLLAEKELEPDTGRALPREYILRDERAISSMNRSALCIDSPSSVTYFVLRVLD